MTSPGNTEYYRELVDYVSKVSLLRGCSIAIANDGDLGVHDLFATIRLCGKGVDLLSEGELAMPTASSAIYTSSFNFGTPSQRDADTGILRVDRSATEPQIELELPVVQPKRTLFSKNQCYLGASQSMPVRVETTIYWSGGPPLALDPIEFQFEVAEMELTFEEILDRFKLRAT